MEHPIFVTIDCGSLAKRLAGHELSGFETANGGTVFLDENSNLPYDLQVSLLHVIQEILRYRYPGTNRALVSPHPAPDAGARPVYGGRESSLKEAGIDAEYEMIVETLKKVNFNKSKAARLLNIDRKTLYNKMSQYRELKNQ